MASKRKRSDSEISSSSSPLLSSPSPHNAMSSFFQSPYRMDTTSSYLSTRTRKRHRDNRPSESTIHEQTLSILYSAQKHSHQTSPSLEPLTSEPVTVTNYSSLSSQQTSLHSFWALPSRPSSCGSSNASDSSPPPAVMYEATNCEDCAAALISVDGDAMDVDMDVDMSGGSNDYGCSRCGKQVCHRCAISNLGAQRRCLNCASKRQWLGGIGWVNQD